jgi:hypothetical protein
MIGREGAAQKVHPREKSHEPLQDVLNIGAGARRRNSSMLPTGVINLLRLAFRLQALNHILRERGRKSTVWRVYLPSRRANKHAALGKDRPRDRHGVEDTLRLRTSLLIGRESSSSRGQWRSLRC